MVPGNTTVKDLVGPSYRKMSLIAEAGGASTDAAPATSATETRTRNVRDMESPSLDGPACSSGGMLAQHPAGSRTVGRRPRRGGCARATERGHHARS